MTLAFKTSQINLPLLAPSQAGKTITHNEALLMIDALMQLTVLKIVTLPPDPEIEDGQCVRVGEATSGIFEGHVDDIAQFEGGTWRFFTPKKGWRTYNLEDERLEVFEGQSWQILCDAKNAHVTRLGIGTLPDTSLSLSAFGDASLFNGAQGHQVKVNRPLAADTASMLFTTAHEGQAEIGLAGSEALSFKLSDDGQNWSVGMSLDLSAGMDVGVALKREGHKVWDEGNAPGLIYDRGAIGNNTDLNGLTHSGVYTQTSNYGATTGLNYPKPFAGKLTVHELPNGVQQTYRLYGGAPNNQGDAIFVRSLYGGVWRVWRKLLSEVVS